MPSSLIFTGLVVVWLLILVPAVARHQQEVARPSGASLAGRVLARPRRRGAGHPTEEGDSVDSVDEDDARAVTTRSRASAVVRTGSTVRVPTQSRWRGDDDHDTAEEIDDIADETDDHIDDHIDDEFDDRLADEDAPDDDRLWERPPPRYRPGRGGFDPEADAATAQRRYASRQRVVLGLLIAALLTAVVAAVAVPMVWWAHVAAAVALVGYLVHLRRQVREEAAIRERRTARMAGTRRPPAADDPELDGWARRGQDATRHPTPLPEPADDVDEPAAPDELPEELTDGCAEDGDTTRVRGVGEPVGLLPARRRGAADDEPESALPRLRPAPPPPLPPGTSLVVVDDEDLELHDLAGPERRVHRRAVGE